MVTMCQTIQKHSIIIIIFSIIILHIKNKNTRNVSILLCNIKSTLVKKNTVYVKTFCHQDTTEAIIGIGNKSGSI